MQSENKPTRFRRRTAARIIASSLALVLIPAGLAGAGPDSGGWTPAEKIDDVAGNDSNLNTRYLDGCPAQSPDGLSLFMASNRPGGDVDGDLDIWMASRAHMGDPWGPPQILPPPINSASDDFCPTPIEGGGLIFVSRRTIEGVTCGSGDLYVSRRNPTQGWSAPQHLDCDPAGPNSALDEQGPSYVQGRLYFSRSSATVKGELFVSRQHGDGFAAAGPILELNDPNANDIQPNLRKDGRELVFSSNRAGGVGGQDIWTATRASVHDPWSEPVNLGPAVNTGRGETRPFLSSDAAQLLFGRAGSAGTGEGGTGASDIYVSTRVKNPPTPFAGTWVGQDPIPPDGDGSTVHLTIADGSNPVIDFTDEFGSVCVFVGSPVTEFIGRLTGRIDGSTLNATFRNARCGPVAVHFLVGESYSLLLEDGGTNDPADDTLFDGSVLWSRA